MITENYVYNSLSHYFKVLGVTGYYRMRDIRKLLVLIFIYKLVFENYRKKISTEDYRVYEEALECLFGTSCLIPYADYLKMGKLKLGDITELLDRVKDVSNLEDRVAKNEMDIDDIKKKDREQDILIAQKCHCSGSGKPGDDDTIKNLFEDVAFIDKASTE